TGLGMMGSAAIGLLVLVWWLFFSRAPRRERWVVLAVMIALAAATRPFLDKSISNAMMGMMFTIYSIPVLSLALTAWTVATRGLSEGPRRAALVATILVVSGGWLLLRTEGISGEGRSQLAWRWTKTPEQRLLARAEPVPGAVVPAPEPKPSTEEAP